MDDGRPAQGTVHELVPGLEQRHVVLEVADGRVLRVQVQLDRQRVARRDELDVTAAGAVRVGRHRRSRFVHVAEQAQAVVPVRGRLIDDRSV